MTSILTRPDQQVVSSIWIPVTENTEDTRTLVLQQADLLGELAPSCTHRRNWRGGIPSFSANFKLGRIHAANPSESHAVSSQEQLQAADPLVQIFGGPGIGQLVRLTDRWILATPPWQYTSTAGSGFESLLRIGTNINRPPKRGLPRPPAACHARPQLGGSEVTGGGDLSRLCSAKGIFIFIIIIIIIIFFFFFFFFS